MKWRSLSYTNTRKIERSSQQSADNVGRVWVLPQMSLTTLCTTYGKVTLYTQDSRFVLKNHFDFKPPVHLHQANAYGLLQIEIHNRTMKLLENKVPKLEALINQLVNDHVGTYNKNVIQIRDLAVDKEVWYKKKLEGDSWKSVKVVNSRGNRSYEVKDGENGAVYVRNERFIKPRVPEPATIMYSELIHMIKHVLTIHVTIKGKDVTKTFLLAKRPERMVVSRTVEMVGVKEVGNLESKACDRGLTRKWNIIQLNTILDSLGSIGECSATFDVATPCSAISEPYDNKLDNAACDMTCSPK
ncbi:hypothetical protein J6590_021708 [Homalodisca vitripennis]|nr:hypothetical protein J6590_021708 [Homalodisca vitripennis]